MTPSKISQNAEEPQATRWPNFFIVGAGRSGTTSLYHYLRKHPDIYMPPIKEPHFLADVDPSVQRLRYLRMKVITEEKDYLRLFSGAGTRHAVGEASPSYIYDKNSPARIEQKAREAKIIILLRDPIDRAYSHYLTDVREGVQRKRFYDALMSDKAQPGRAWGAPDLYIELGLYYDQVKRYLDTFGPEQVRIYLYEDLVSDTAGLVNNVCDFLGVDFHHGQFFDAGKKYNAYARPRNSLFRWMTGVALMRSLAITLVPGPLLGGLRERLMMARPPKPPMDARARELLEQVYPEDIGKLQTLIERDLSGWLAGGKK